MTLPTPAPLPPTRRTCLRVAAAAATWAGVRPLQAADAPAAGFWAALRQPGTVVLMRHAQTEPGIGDPPGFQLAVCSSQRNLSDSGRAQARRVGEAFAAQGIVPGEVRSSAWCRCLDTARLAFGRAQVWAPINSFFNGQGDRNAGKAAVLAAARDWRGPAPLVLVTHQVNISHYSGEFTAMGEMLAVRHEAGRLQVLGRLLV